MVDVGPAFSPLSAEGGHLLLQSSWQWDLIALGEEIMRVEMQGVCMLGGGYFLLEVLAGDKFVQSFKQFDVLALTTYDKFDHINEILYCWHLMGHNIRFEIAIIQIFIDPSFQQITFHQLLDILIGKYRFIWYQIFLQFHYTLIIIIHIFDICMHQPYNIA